MKMKRTVTEVVCSGPFRRGAFHILVTDGTQWERKIAILAQHEKTDRTERQ